MKTSLFSLSLLQVLLIFFSVVLVRCTREPGEPPPNPTQPIDSLPNPPKPVDTVPVPPADTVSYVQRLEEYYVQGNPVWSRLNRVYTFAYDGLNRVTTVGITNHNGVQFDTATTRLFYSGSNPRPSMIITPNQYTGNPTTPPLFDTTYFWYDGQHRPVRDSGGLWGYYLGYTMSQQPAWRNYFYPDNGTMIVHWYAATFTNTPPGLVRQDTVKLAANRSLEKIKTQYFSPNNVPSNYLLTEWFTPGTIINPLAKLNIGGMIFSYVYTPTYTEVLGNAAHKAVHNSNILAYYLDFFSPLLPRSFYMGGFTANDFLISAQYDAMTVEVTPWQKRSDYPAEITVRGSTSYPDDRFVYRYYYR
jgi:hypothetical protein